MRSGGESRGRSGASASLAAAASVALAVGAPAWGETPLRAVRVAQGLSFPLYVAAPPGDTARVFIVERRGTDNRGRIKILRNGSILATPFLTTEPLASGNEQGLLGLAFAPDYATSGRFYIYSTDATGTSILARHTVGADPDVANATGTVILSVPQPFANHNGGWIAFGPDGYLYVALGDGGGSGDPGDRAQDVQQLLGKILRLDVSGATYTIPPGNPFAGPIEGQDEIWSFGLRNPWRCSFDRLTGDLVIADVGQGTLEEVDFAPASSGGGAGANYGWRCYEGSQPFAPSTTTPCDSCTNPVCPFVSPAHEYDHSGGRCSITGGYVYRGCAIPDLNGEYFFADYCAAKIYSGRFQSGQLTGIRDRTAELAPGGGLSIADIPSFGEDARGELYICDSQDGEVYRVAPAATVQERDAPLFARVTALGDSVGATGKGNAFLPGVTPFLDAGSRIRGVGYLRDAWIRDCGSATGDCATSRLRLGSFDIDLEACVDIPQGTLTRRFIFVNRAGGAQALAYADVIAPRLKGDADGASMASGSGPSGSAVLVQYDSFAPDRWIVHSGTGPPGTAYSADVDTAAEIAARVAADQPLAGGTAAGPAAVALALGFDIGMASPGVPETLVVVTRVQGGPPSGVQPTPVPGVAALRLRGPNPSRAPVIAEIGLRRAGPVSVDVFDVSGRRVRGLWSGWRAAGWGVVEWDGRLDRGGTAPSGIYWLRLRAGGTTHVRRAVLIR